MKLFEFTFEAPHPENPAVTVRFFIEAPCMPGAAIPDGALLELHLKWRSDRND